MAENGIVVASRTSPLHTVERAIEAIRDTSSRRVFSTPSLEDPLARYFSGGYIRRALIALLNSGQFGVGSGRIYVAVNPKQALPYATKWILDADARKEAIRYTAEKLQAIGVSERDVEQYLMDPTIFAFSESASSKLVTTNGARGYLATKEGEHLCLVDFTPDKVKQLYEMYGINFLDALRQMEKS